MTPPVPRGSDAGSPIPTSDPTQVRAEAPSASESPAVAPLRLSLESSYLAGGSAGFPLRAGVLFTYRPNPFLGIGLHADSNFTDHFGATLRLEGIWPAHRYFHLEGAVELGARGLINQSQSIQGMMQPISGAAFTFGGEIAASVPFSDLFGLSIFARAFYSPGGGFSAPPPDMGNGPSRGIEWSGGEVMFGLRVDIYPPVAPRLPVASEELETSHHPAVVAETSAPAPREALQTFQATLDRILRETSATPVSPPSGDAGTLTDGGRPSVPDSGSAAVSDATADPAPGSAASGGTRDEMLALQREIQVLAGSVSSLETEIQGATQLLNDLSIGQEAGEPFHIRLDGLYDQLTTRPPQLDVAALNTFLSEFRQILRDSDPLRLLIQSSTETFGPAILRNLRAYETALQRHQRALPTRAASGRPARGDLDEALAQLGTVVQQIDQLRLHPETTTPPASQVSLWHVRLDRIREHLNVLDNRLDDASYDSLNEQFARLQHGFDGLMSSMENARLNWMTSRALFSHYQNLWAARRPAQAEAALRGMMTELTGAPESFRRLRERNINSLRVAVERFLQQHLTPEPWSAARERAVSVLRWIDPSYTPPSPPEPRPARRAARVRSEASAPGATTLHFPPRSGRTGGRDE